MEKNKYRLYLYFLLVKINHHSPQVWLLRQKKFSHDPDGLHVRLTQWFTAPVGPGPVQKQGNNTLVCKQIRIWWRGHSGKRWGNSIKGTLTRGLRKYLQRVWLTWTRLRKMNESLPDRQWMAFPVDEIECPLQNNDEKIAKRLREIEVISYGWSMNYVLGEGGWEWTGI